MTITKTSDKMTIVTAATTTTQQLLYNNNNNNNNRDDYHFLSGQFDDADEEEDYSNATTVATVIIDVNNNNNTHRTRTHSNFDNHVDTNRYHHDTDDKNKNNNDNDHNDQGEYDWYDETNQPFMSKSSVSSLKYNHQKKKFTSPISSTITSPPAAAAAAVAVVTALSIKTQQQQQQQQQQQYSASSLSSCHYYDTTKQNNNDDDDEYDDDYENDHDLSSLTTNTTTTTNNTKISHKVQNRVQQLQYMEQLKRTLHTDKNDRATSEQVLDPRTRYILFKLLQSNFIQQFNGCISTGKEANVYYAIAGSGGSSSSGSSSGSAGHTTGGNSNSNGTMTNVNGAVVTDTKISKHKRTVGSNTAQPLLPLPLSIDAATTTTNTLTSKDENKNTDQSKTPSDTEITEYAIKIYKTSILVFKDRDKYVSGEYRYRNGYCKSNPRKMISIWAEKEIRNYKRIYYNSTIPCPKPIYIKQHVLVMEFLGTDGWPSPRLKDVVFTDSNRNKKYYNLYIQCILILRRLIHQCRLVHGDYSEYNLLYHQNIIYVIDVSQSVELNHPIAMDLLKQDIINITDYFKKIFYKTNYSTGSSATTTTTNIHPNPTTTTLPVAAQEGSAKESDTFTNSAGGITNDEHDYKKDEFYLLNSIEAFDYIMAEYGDATKNDTGTIASNNDAYEKEQLLKILEEGKERRGIMEQQKQVQKEQQQQLEYEAMMKERIFLNSFIPRTLYEITVTEKDYATPNTAATTTGSGTGSRSTRAPLEEQAIAAMTIKTSTTTIAIATESTVPIAPPVRAHLIDDDTPVVTSSGDDANDDVDDSANSDSSCDDSEYEDENEFGPRVRTNEELEQERQDRKESRRSNKKMVKEQQSIKRQNKKIKKKDKKRAISKTKSKA